MHARWYLTSIHVSGLSLWVWARAYILLLRSGIHLLTILVHVLLMVDSR